MIEFIKQQDTALYIFINHFGHNPILNFLFSLLSGVGTWGIVWIIIALILFFWEEKKNHQKLIELFWGLGFSIVIVEIIKNITKRVRPEIAIPFTISISEKLSSYSFPSGHTTIAFAAAYILANNHKKLKWLYYLLAILISYSRIYLGKHYPSDVMAGIVLGFLIGKLSLMLTKKPTSTSGVEIKRGKV